MDLSGAAVGGRAESGRGGEGRRRPGSSGRRSDVAPGDLMPAGAGEGHHEGDVELGKPGRSIDPVAGLAHAGDLRADPLAVGAHAHRAVQ